MSTIKSSLAAAAVAWLASSTVHAEDPEPNYDPNEAVEIVKPPQSTPRPHVVDKPRFDPPPPPPPRERKPEPIVPPNNGQTGEQDSPDV